MKKRRLEMFAFLAAFLAVAVGVAGSPLSQGPQNLIEGYPLRSLLPSDAIPALDEPSAVPADEARHIEGASRVLGVVVNSQARAYSLDLLNHHEVVNDVLGGVAIAATW